MKIDHRAGRFMLERQEVTRGQVGKRDSLSQEGTNLRHRAHQGTVGRREEARRGQDVKRPKVRR